MNVWVNHPFKLRRGWLSAATFEIYLRFIQGTKELSSHSGCCLIMTYFLKVSQMHIEPCHSSMSVAADMRREASLGVQENCLGCCAPQMWSCVPWVGMPTQCDVSYLSSPLQQTPARVWAEVTPASGVTHHSSGSARSHSQRCIMLTVCTGVEYVCGWVFFFTFLMFVDHFFPQL